MKKNKSRVNLAVSNTRWFSFCGGARVTEHDPLFDFWSAVPARIDKNFEKVYNIKDIVICSAEGLPRPTVTWSRVSGSIPVMTSEQSGEGQAVLRNLHEGDHVWHCTAKNDLGSDKITVEFAGKLTFTVFHFMVKESKFIGSL